ncbi:MAG: transcription elongation factor GreA [Lachnospiraceae bacterium]|jgi:transcription elongation factor GreA|nr:transcription elongation factor GreA [Lachnospiraceae bacterium]
MEGKKNQMTRSGLEKLENELHYLKVEKRQEIAQKIKEAREQGDLSENAEYDAAKDEQRDIEARIEELENILKNAEVVGDDDVEEGTIGIGSQVKLKDLDEDEEVIYKIVGTTEANVLEGFISNDSPLGRALIGKKKNTKVEVDAPGGVIKYKIMSVKKY